ncbi:MAG: 1,4-dihydroxy-6-naphthoate synthase [Dehalococcoidia bacterium]|nr:1,4-dihydroxy-6-naphthoate synthase [Dehalococcoidia bacterium]
MTWTPWTQIDTLGTKMEEVVYEKKTHTFFGAGVARISVNRPKRYNAIRPETEDEMFRCFYDASHDPNIGAVILTGIGDHFGTGGDVAWEVWGTRKRFYHEYPPNRMIRVCKKPVIAAVKGYCIGGHNHFAYCSDFTIATETAIFGQNGPRVASPSDGFVTQYLVRVVGAKKARELWMGCHRYTADEALEMGLVNRVVPVDRLDAEVDRWCEDILKASPACIEILKATFDGEIDAMPNIGLKVASMYPDFFDSPECKEGPASFLEKRQPNFWKARQQVQH